MTGKRRKKTTTIVLDIPVYTHLKDLKIIPEESFNSVIRRLIDNSSLKGQRRLEEWVASPKAE